MLSSPAPSTQRPVSLGRRVMADKKEISLPEEFQDGGVLDLSGIKTLGWVAWSPLVDQDDVQDPEADLQVEPDLP